MARVAPSLGLQDTSNMLWVRNPFLDGLQAGALFAWRGKAVGMVD